MQLLAKDGGGLQELLNVCSAWETEYEMRWAPQKCSVLYGDPTYKRAVYCSRPGPACTGMALGHGNNPSEGVATVLERVREK